MKFKRLNKRINESIPADEVLKTWDFLVDRVDAKMLCRTFISAMQLQEPTMAMFLEKVYNEMPTDAFFECIRETISQEPDGMAFAIVWLIKKFKLDKECKKWLEEEGLK